MIMTVSELRRYMTTDEEDSALEGKLQALELLIRSYTNNNFQQRAVRCYADIMGGSFMLDALQPFQAGDTVQVTRSEFNNNQLFTVEKTENRIITVKEETIDEDDVLITRVVYPMDVKMGVVNLMKWEANNRDKVGIASESISRHSVTYFDMGDENSIMGYPKSLMGFLRPHMKARFGQGVLK